MSRIGSYSTRVLGDQELEALRIARSVLADSNHPGKAAAIASLDRVIAPPPESPQAYRLTCTYNPGHEIDVAAEDGIAFQIVRSGSNGEAMVSHRLLERPLPPGIPHKVIGYSTTVIVSKDGQ